MIVKTIVALLAIFCLCSCAPVGSGLKIEGNTLSCDHPRLNIQFKKDIIYSAEKGKNGGRSILFDGDARAMSIEFLRVPHSTKIDYFLSLREIASNCNLYYLGDAKFGDKEWAKTAYYDEGSGSLLCGYFTNKDNEFIFISVNALYISRSEKDALMKYKKTMIMPEEGLKIIDEQFAYLDEVAEIR